MHIKNDPDFEQYIKKWACIYEEKNYNKGLIGTFLNKSHGIAERSFNNDVYFNKVLEVGAGTGKHFKYINHKYDEYWITDLNPEFLSIAKSQMGDIKKEVFFSRQDATSLTFEDNTFDRLIAAHVLEHLKNPHLVLREWARVLSPGGVLTLILPCDPGVWWRLGRVLVAKKGFRDTGIDYDYWMAREHINAINNLVALIEYYFNDRKDIWWPCFFPSVDLNLFYIVHATLSNKNE